MQTNFSEETYLTIILTTLLLLVSGAMLVYFFFRHQKKRFQHEQEVLELHESFNQLILQSKLEIQEFTLDHIAKELHANFSHMVSLININLSVALADSQGEAKDHIIEAKRLAKQLMAEVKVLSVSLNSDHIMKSGFDQALENEISRLSRAGKYEVQLIRTGIRFRIAPEKEIVLFRLCQEILNNIVKHAKAEKITATIDYFPDRLCLAISDDGIGFDPDEARERSIEKSSTGLMNIAGRAERINANLNIESGPGKGTTVNVLIPITEKSK
jgi:signal transduction histidine kinase